LSFSGPLGSAFAVACKLLGEDHRWSQILFGARHFFYDDSLPTE